ncbi:hypothetical protein J6590_038284 [Homalodisca vitripennis]|nr:hypothetical protein J6590_038284 [Homalodisca vitripennis]
MPNIACIVLSDMQESTPVIRDDRYSVCWPDPLECFHCYYLSTATCKNRPQLSRMIVIASGWPDPLECFHCYYLSTAVIVIHHNLMNTTEAMPNIACIVLSDMQESTPIIKDDRYSVWLA